MSAPIWFDTHAHLDDERFDESRQQVIADAQRAGVTRMICVGTSLPTSQKCVSIAEQFDGVYAAVGIQPNYVAEAGDEDMAQIVDLASHPSVVAIGETGLDRYWDDSPFDQQIDFFRKHVELSISSGKAFIVHMRDCEVDMEKFLRQAHSDGLTLHGVMHSYTGGPVLRDLCLELGMYISFAGMVTYKKSKELREVARQVPLERLLIETDSPYLSPEPKRGVRPNHPGLVIHTGECLADVFGIAPSELASQTTKNACQLFGIP